MKNERKTESTTQGADEIAATSELGAKGTGNTGKGLSKIDNPVDLTDFRKDHILNRHRAGAGKGKDECPANWSDERILHNISDIATDPKAVTGIGKWNSPYAIGVRDGVKIRVDFYPPTHPHHAGKISTAYPPRLK
ncbi:EndoU domain-containing protein [Exiguobacterium algae]|uniref:EndoU domain-containing protein n=1 Tax=Exiguobacterium algae TaxID=2751250 RepID=UPI001BEAE78F|nr:EndoU domain-containing protein [Exiguobacterium algae]